MKYSQNCIDLIKSFEGFSSKMYNDPVGHCFPPGNLVRTERGYIPIEDVIIGDKVIGSKGIFQNVTNTFSRLFTGEILEIHTYGSPPITTTKDHLFYNLYKKRERYGRGRRKVNHYKSWLQACDLGKKSYLHSPIFQSDKVIESIEIPYEFTIMNNFNRSKGSDRPASKLTQEDVNKIRFLAENGMSTREISNLFPVTQSTIQRIVYNKAWKKVLNHSLMNGNNTFKVDSLFLWVIGLYIAEGSNDKYKINFSLHCKEIDLALQVKNLFEPMGYTVSIKPTEGTNGMEVEVYSTKLGSWMPLFCGKWSQNKKIPHEILNLSPEMVTHTLMGIIDGDGYINKYSDSDDIGQTSKILSLQISEIARRIGGQPTLSIIDRSIKNSNFQIIYVNTGVTPYGNRRSDNKRCIVKDKEGFFYKVKNIKTISYNGMVYNLEVDGDHTYTINNTTVHNCTIGYGTLVHLGNINGTEPEELKKGISKDIGEELLKKEIDKINLSSIIDVDLTQEMVDALISFIYNIGINAFKKSTMLKKINSKDFEGAAKEFKKWCKAGGRVLPGLVIRRSKEESLFRKGIK